MAGVIGVAFVDIRPDMSGFGRQVQSGMGPVSGEAEKAGKTTGTAFGSGMKTTIAVAAGSMIASFAQTGISKITEFVGGSISAASDLSETLNKVGVVFGENAGQVKDWSKNAATSFGLSRQEALSSVATFGDMFSQLGFGGAQAATASEGMVQLAADLGSFHNVDPSDVLERLGAAFRGEYDSIQKLVPGITAARVEQEALRMTGKTSTDQLTAADKALATQAILMHDSANAAGDFAETSDGLANKQRIASAQFKDLQAALGNLLLPALTLVMGAITDGLMPAFTAIGNWISDHMDVIQALAIGLGAIGIVILVSLVPAFIAWAAAALAAAAATLLAAAPLLLLGAAVAALAFLIINNWDTIKAVTAAVWDFMLGIIRGVWDWISNNWPLLLAIITGPIGIAVWLIKNNLDTILGFFVGVFDTIKNIVSGAIDAVVGFFSALPGRIWGFVQSVKDAAIGVGTAVINGIGQGLSAIVGFAGDLTRVVADAVKGAINSVIDLLNNAIPNSLGWGPASIDLPDDPIPRLHTGGTVPGRPGEDVWSLLRAGETVLTPAQLSAIVSGAPGADAGGPMVSIGTVNVASGVDLDLLTGRLTAALTSTRLGA